MKYNHILWIDLTSQTILQAKNAYLSAKDLQAASILLDVMMCILPEGGWSRGKE